MKPFLIILLLSVFTTTAIGQTQESLVSDFERAKSLSLDYIQAMPEEHFDYQPTEEVRTYAQQFLHASQGTFNLVSNGTGTERKYANKSLEGDASLQSKAEVTRIVTESFDYAIKAIQNMDADSMDEIVEKGPFKITRLVWIQKGYEHVSHHRGQCAIYLRMKGVKPPRYKLF